MSNDKVKDLCLKLIQADTEALVIELLKKASYWDDEKQWRWLGDAEYNYSSVGNQQSRAEQAIIEKLINSVDTKLIAAARIAGCLPKNGTEPQSPNTPKTISDARDLFFKEELKDSEALSYSITVAATGAKPRDGRGRPCFTIVDNGEGQTPKNMPNTILSLHKGNKDKIKFVQGKFNMGGTGVLEFCGIERNVQLVISKRNPALLEETQKETADADWSFTIIRREDPTEGNKSSRFSYLAPLNAEAKPREGELLHFSTKNLPIFPEKDEAYARESEWGTLIKLYEYDAQRFKTNMMMKDGLKYRAQLLLPEPALPIRFHECRKGYKGHSGSFDTTMVGLLQTLHEDYEHAGRDNVEWYDKLPFDIEGERFTALIYLFKNKDAAETYRKDEGIIFTYNGQCHAVMTKDFFRRKSVKQDYLWHSLLMFIDCSNISPRAHEKLFMNSRDRLRDGDLKRRLEEELEDQLGRHEELKMLASERRKKELAETPKASESMARVIESLITKNPALAALLGQGMRIKNPHKPENAGVGAAGFTGKRFPTKFHFKGQQPGDILSRDAYINSHVRITFETDAANDYFKRDDEPGECTLYRKINGKLEVATNYQSPRLYNGLAHLSLGLPEECVEGDELEFEVHVTDKSQIEPFQNAFKVKTKAEREVLPPSEPPAIRPPKIIPSDSEGTEKSSNKNGEGQTNDSYLDIPDPIEVYEKDWATKDPKFDKFTAIRIIEPPDSTEATPKYDYYINMSNIYLQTFLKQEPKIAATLKLKFKAGMMLVAFSLLHQEQLHRKGNTSEDMLDNKTDVRERVAQTTSALAPFLLPMIDGVSELEEPEESLSQSAGEAA